jgi:hypothetical protein
MSPDVEPELGKSDTAWEDQISSQVRIGDFRVKAVATDQRVEYLTELASLYPIPEIPTAFVFEREAFILYCRLA